MGTLLKYLLSAKGERSVLGKIGQWRLQVSQTLDQVNQTLGALVQTVNNSDLGAPLYITTQRADTEQVLSAPADIILNAVANNTGISYNTATGEYSLAPGTYELEFYGQFESFPTATSSVVVEWVDEANGVLVPGTEAQYLSVASTVEASNKPVAKAIYELAVAGIVKIRATQVNPGGEAIVELSVDSYAIVRKIG